jgi:hypothetical protein
MNEVALAVVLNHLRSGGSSRNRESGDWSF